MSRTRRSPAVVAPALPWALLHLLAAGERLPQDEGEARYGPTYRYIESWRAPHVWRGLWSQHGVEITAHARRLGRSQPWIVDRVQP